MLFPLPSFQFKSLGIRLFSFSFHAFQSAASTRARMRVSNHIGRCVTHFESRFVAEERRITWIAPWHEGGMQWRNENSERDRENGRVEEESGIPVRGEIKTALFCLLSCPLSFSLRSFLYILTEPRPLYVEKEDTRWSEDEIQEIYAWMIIVRSKIDKHPLG